MSEQEYLTTGEAATALGVSADTIRTMVRTGRLDGTQVNVHMRVTRESVERVRAERVEAEQ